jgi:DNA-binding protein YbaB
MKQIKFIPKDRTIEFILKTKEKLLKLQNNLISTIRSYSDENKLFELAMDNIQVVHSIIISDRLFEQLEKMKNIDMMVRLINRAIVESSLIYANDLSGVIIEKEVDDILSNESQGIIDSLKELHTGIEKSHKELSLINRTYNSSNGDITLMVAGDRMIKTLTISDDYLTVEKKSKLENELKEVINFALHDIIMEVRNIMSTNEEEYLQKVILI